MVEFAIGLGILLSGVLIGFVLAAQYQEKDVLRNQIKKLEEVNVKLEEELFSAKSRLPEKEKPQKVEVAKDPFELTEKYINGEVDFK
jgi:ligand-binding sensor protein